MTDGSLGSGVIYVGAGVDTGKNLSDKKPITDGITEVEVHQNPNIALSKKKVGYINQPDLPEIFNQLNTEEAKNEFRAFWTLVERIKSNRNAHQFSEKKRLITLEPLKLNNFLSEVKNNEEFQLDKFLSEHGITLERSLLDGAELNDAKLYEAELNDAELNRAWLNGAWLNLAKLNGAELNGAVLNNAKLNDAELNDAKLNDAELNRAQLNGAKLNNAELYGAKLNDADLTNAQLNGAQLNGAKLNGAKLNDAELTYANLTDAKLHDAVLNGAVLNGAKLQNAVLYDAVLNGAKLQNAVLYDAVLYGAVLNGAKLHGIELNSATLFDKHTQLDQIKCNFIVFEGTKIEGQSAIKEKFIKLGAKEENISFAQAA